MSGERCVSYKAVLEMANMQSLYSFSWEKKRRKKIKEVFAFTRWSPAETTGETGELVKINLPHDLLMVWEEWEFSGVSAGM